MATVRPGVMKKLPFDAEKAGKCRVEKVQVSLAAGDMKTRVLEVVKETRKLVDLTGADVVVSVGRGISKDVEKGMAELLMLIMCLFWPIVMVKNLIKYKRI